MVKWISLYIKCACFSRFSKKITDKRRLSTDKIPTHCENIESNNCEAAAAATGSTSSDQLHKIGGHKNLLDLCTICQRPFNVAESNRIEANIDNIVSCSRCLSQTCKSPRCTIWLPKHDHWECSNCHHFDCISYVRAYDWIFERLNQRFDDKAAVVRVTKAPPINATSLNVQDDVMLELNGNLMRSAYLKWCHLLSYKIVDAKCLILCLSFQINQIRRIITNTITTESSCTGIHWRFTGLHARWFPGQCMRWTDLQEFRV